MRKLLRYLLGLIVAITLFIWLANPMGWWESLQAKNYSSDENERSSITYLLDSSKWLVFKKPSFSHKLKFIFTANLSPNLKIIENISDLRYSVSYEVLDSKGRVLATKTYHLRTAYLLFLDNKQQIIKKSYYFNNNLKPSLGEHMILDLTPYPEADKVRLKLNSKESRIVDVAIRSYHLETITQQNKQHIKWERISKDRKEYLARGNIYNSTLMTQQEKNLLISSYWRPNGPLGIEDKAYRTRRLVISDWENIHPYSDIKPVLYSDANLSATRYLNEGNYTLEVTPLAHGDTNLSIKRYDTLKLLSHQNHQLQESSTRIALQHSHDGIVEIESNQSVKIEIIENQSNQRLYLPSLFSNSYYDINQTQPIRYRFYTPKERLLQLECYALSDFNQSEQNSTLQFLLRNHQGKLIKSIENNITLLPSHYDYRDDFKALTQPSKLYIQISKEVASVDIVSHTKALIVRLSTRSRHIAYPLYSFNAYEAPEYPFLPSWFPIEPDNSSNIMNQQTKLYKQPKPPKPNPFIQSGLYDYEQIFPKGSWRGYTQLLERKFGFDAIRSQSWSTLYAKVDANNSTFVFNDKRAVVNIAPQLIYHDLRERPQTLTIYQDNKAIVSKKLYRSTGSIQLPPLLSDHSYSLDINLSSKANLYLSHTSNGSKLYNKRTFIAFDKPLSFEVSKDAIDSTLNLQLATPHQSESNATEFFATIKKIDNNTNETKSSWSYQSYHLFANTKHQKSINLTNPKEPLHISNSLYLSLGENLAKGRYSVTLYPPKDQKIYYLFISHLTLGKEARVQLSKEKIW